MDFFFQIANRLWSLAQNSLLWDNIWPSIVLEQSNSDLYCFLLIKISKIKRTDTQILWFSLFHPWLQKHDRWLSLQLVKLQSVSGISPINVSMGCWDRSGWCLPSTLCKSPIPCKYKAWELLTVETQENKEHEFNLFSQNSNLSWCYRKFYH